MKNVLKKSIAILLSVLMITGLCVMAVSADAPNATEVRTLTVHKYLVDDLGAAAFQTPATGAELDTTAIETAGATKLDGIEFKVIRAYNEEELGGVTAGYTQVGTTGYYFLTALTGAKGDTTGAGSNDDGEAVYTFASNGSEDGVYAVVEQDSNKVRTKADPFLVNIPMVDPSDSDEWLYDVHVYPKNGSDEMNIVKTFVSDETEESYALGEKITWKIEVNIPVAVEDMDEFRIVDDFSGQFDLIYDDSVFNDYGSDVIVELGGVPLTEGIDYDVDYVGGELIIDFTDYIATTLVGNEEKILSITFDTKLSAAVKAIAVDNDGYGFKNSAILEYTDPESKVKTNLGTKTSIDPVAYFCSITINKFASGDALNKLVGAKFKIADSLANAQAGTFLQDTTGSGDWEVTTDGTGEAIFGGLWYDLEDNTTYYLVETEAPTGYNKLNKPVGVTVTKDGGNVIVNIANNTGFQLPMTGGAGTLMLSIIGFCLMGGAILMLVISRKRAKTS